MVGGLWWWLGGGDGGWVAMVVVVVGCLGGRVVFASLLLFSKVSK